MRYKPSRRHVGIVLAVALLSLIPVSLVEIGSEGGSTSGVAMEHALATDPNGANCLRSELIRGYCGGVTTATTTAGQMTLASSTSPSSCHVQPGGGHDAELVFSSDTLDVAPMCDDWVQKSAAQGEIWVENQPITSSGAELTTMCVLHSGSVTANVVDSGLQTYGQDACRGLLAAGWLEPGSGQ